MVLLLRTPARRLMWLLLLLFGLLAPLPAAAQESGVVGTVRDTSGAVVAGTDITLTNTQTGESRRVDDQRRRAVRDPERQGRNLPAHCRKSRLSEARRGDLKLEVELVRTVDVVLSVGTVADQVSVVNGCGPAAGRGLDRQHALRDQGRQRVPAKWTKLPAAAVARARRHHGAARHVQRCSDRRAEHEHRRGQLLGERHAGRLQRLPARRRLVQRLDPRHERHESRQSTQSRSSGRKQATTRRSSAPTPAASST